MGKINKPLTGNNIPVYCDICNSLKIAYKTIDNAFFLCESCKDKLEPYFENAGYNTGKKLGSHFQKLPRNMQLWKGVLPPKTIPESKGKRVIPITINPVTAITGKMKQGIIKKQILRKRLTEERKKQSKNVYNNPHNIYRNMK